MKEETVRLRVSFSPSQCQGFSLPTCGLWVQFLPTMPNVRVKGFQGSGPEHEKLSTEKQPRIRAGARVFSLYCHPWREEATSPGCPLASLLSLSISVSSLPESSGFTPKLYTVLSLWLFLPPSALLCFLILCFAPAFSHILLAFSI